MKLRWSSALGYAGAALAAIAASWLASRYSYLLFHSLIESFGIGVAAAIFAVAWNTRRLSSNGYLTYVGIAYLFVACLDLVHLLAYKGMGVFPDHGADTPTQLWIAARSLEAVTLLVSPVFLARRLRPTPVLAVHIVVTGLVLAAIFPLDAFPICYVEEGPGQGLTPFKIGAEYVICAVLCAAYAAGWRVRRRFAADVFALVATAIGLSILSELAFTKYVSVYGDFNLVGHLLKAGSFVAVFQATVAANLRDPYHVLFRGLEQQQVAVRASEQRYRSLVEMSPEALVVTRHGRVEFANPAALALFGVGDERHLVGRPWVELMAPEESGLLAVQVDVAADDARHPQVDGRAVKSDGSVRDVEVVASSFRDAAGRAVQILFRDVTERRSAAARLKENARRLEELNRVKDEFLATLSHELRTPMHAIVGWTEMLRRGSLDGPTMRRAHEAIARNARVQSGLIDDVLDVSRIITGKLRFDLRLVDVSEPVAAAIEAIRPTATVKGVELVTVDLPPLWVSGDRDRLQQIVWNLLSNAVKFTPAGGRVQVALRREGAFVEIRVSDSGVGISASALPHLFERFWQADTSSTREQGGLGLGLAIVRHLVELHGGKVRAESRGEGWGASFTVTLPGKGAERAAVDDEAPAPRRADAPAVWSPTLSGLKVLVVDDEEDSGELVEAVLAASGAAVKRTTTAGAALRLITDWRPAVLVSDIAMPGEDGYALIRRVRALPPEQGGGTPAIALTAYGQEQDRQRALDAGFDAHLSKPATAATMTAAVAAMVPASSPDRLAPVPPGRYEVQP